MFESYQHTCAADSFSKFKQELYLRVPEVLDLRS